MGRFVSKSNWNNGDNGIEIKHKGDKLLKLLCVFLSVACVIDYRTKRIPNWLLAFMLVAGLWQSSLKQGTENVFDFLYKIACMTLCMYFLFKIGALGAGDVKLLSVCAGYFPGNKILYFLFFSLLIAAAFSLFKMVLQHNARERLRYLGEYLLGVLRSGAWKLYMEDYGELSGCSICMTGPILISVLMYMGGIY